MNEVDFDVAITDDDEPNISRCTFYIDGQANSGGYAFPSSIARVTIVDDDTGSYSGFP